MKIQATGLPPGLKIGDETAVGSRCFVGQTLGNEAVSYTHLDAARAQIHDHVQIMGSNDFGMGELAQQADEGTAGAP